MAQENKKEITREKIEKYLVITEKALAKIKIPLPEGTHMHTAAKDFLDMAKRYFSDAKHFKEADDRVNAFAAVNYAHGWLDAGARMGLFDVDHDSRLVTVD